MGLEATHSKHPASDLDNPLVRAANDKDAVFLLIIGCVLIIGIHPLFHFILTALPEAPRDSLMARLFSASVSMLILILVLVSKSVKRFSFSLQTFNCTALMVSVIKLVVDSGTHYMYISAGLIALFGVQMAFIRIRDLMITFLISSFFYWVYLMVSSSLTMKDWVGFGIYLNGFVIALAFAFLRIKSRQRELLAEQELDTTLSLLRTEHQKLEEANSHIISSIHYARMIQQSVLPDINEVKTHVPECFFLWQPRDIVSGDFYQFYPIPDGFIMIVADCTGHGVPGGFLTMLCSSLIQRTIHNSTHYDPSEIIRWLNWHVRRSLRQDTLQSSSDDGLDIGICIVNKKDMTVRYAGSRIPLLISGGGDILKIKGDSYSIGYRHSDPSHRFQTHTLLVEASTVLYLFTDGYTDLIDRTTKLRYGTKQLTGLLKTHHEKPLKEQKAILKQVLDPASTWTQVDDITAVGFKIG